MLGFTVQFQDRNNTYVQPVGIGITPRRWSARAIGGPDYAEIEATGSESSLWQFAEWLRYGVQIRNLNGRLVWWGFLHEVRLDVAGATVGVTLDRLTNRISTRYSHKSSTGLDTSYTAWAQDEQSVLKYGQIELLENQGDSDEANAIRQRDGLLAQNGRVRGIASPARAETETGCLLVCRGWYETLNWKYYSQPQGFAETGSEGDDEVFLGWGFTSPLGWTNGDKGMHQLGAKLKDLRAGMVLEVSGSVSNNGTKTVAEAATGEKAETYTATTISFETTDDILDSVSGLNFIRTGELILVSGADVAGNNKYHRTDGSGSRAVTTDTVFNGTIAADPAGSSVTITQGIHITLEEAVTKEVPAGNATVLCRGQQAAQRVTWPAAGTWYIGEVWVRMARVGNPTDNVLMKFCTEAGGIPGVILETVTVIGSTLPENTTEWVKFVLTASSGTGGITGTYGANYWMVVHRSGAADAENYYLVEVSEGGPGNARIASSTTWFSRVPQADIPVQVWGVEETTSQIRNIVTTCGQFITLSTIATASGVRTKQYRTGTYKGQDEIDSLLKERSSTNKRMVATVTADRVLRVDVAPTPQLGADWIWDKQGRLRTGGMVAAEPGIVPAGQWLRLAGVPDSIGTALGISPVFMEKVDYDAEAGTWDWDTYEEDVFDLPTIEAG